MSQNVDALMVEMMGGLGDIIRGKKLKKLLEPEQAAAPAEGGDADLASEEELAELAGAIQAEE